LLRIRNLEEEQRRLALEAGVADLHRLETALTTSKARDRRGRELVTASAGTGELIDRLAGLEETRLAIRQADVLAPRIAASQADVNALRQEYLPKRIERRQAETLIREIEAQDSVDAGRKGQQALDDWYRNRRQKAGPGLAGSVHADPPGSESKHPDRDAAPPGGS
jgi:hypothetical protein